ncbi:MAG: hypothetical protein WD404_01585 [Solirubrobacterales bacterium]
MKLLLATNHLGLGGSESYLLTVAEQLDRLGHEVAIYAPEPGEGAGIAREMGIPVLDEGGLGGLDGDYDASLVQDAGVSLQIADRCPGLPQLFVAHSAKFDLQAPPQLDGVVSKIVALNDRVAQRMRSYSSKVDVVRLRQPIDIERFAPRGELPERPRTALLLSNTPSEDRLEMLRRACVTVGLELARLGGPSGHATDVRPAIAAADVVIGYGRSILEGMAMGRAAFVYDWKGGNGWVTAETYEAIEADGIAGGAAVDAIGIDRLGEQLRRYVPSMGPINHDLVAMHHRANVHAQELVALFDVLAQPSPHPRGPLQEMARLVRLEWRSRLENFGLAHENAQLRQRLRESEAQAAAAREQAAHQEERVEDLRQSFESSASWRLTRPVRALARLRKRFARRRDS